MVRKTIYVDGKPQSTEEIVEEPEELIENLSSNNAAIAVDTTNIGKSSTTLQMSDNTEEISSTTVDRIYKRRIIRKIVYIDGVPTEVEEVIEDPDDEDPSTRTTTEQTDNTKEDDDDIQLSVQTKTRKMVKRVVYIDGKPVETEEIIDPETESEVVSYSPTELSVNPEEDEDKISTIVTRRRIMKKIVYIDGQPVETEEYEEEPKILKMEEVPTTSADIPLELREDSNVIQKVATTVKRRRIIKKIVYIDGKPVETEEVVEEPESPANERTSMAAVEQPIEASQSTVKRITKTRRIVKKIVYIDGQPVETEEVVEDPETTTTVVEDPEPLVSTSVQPISNTIRTVKRKRIIKKLIYVDGKPVETEEEIDEDPEISTTEESLGPSMQTDSESTTSSIITTVRRKRIIRKIVYVDGQPIETEEVVEDPDETSMVEGQNFPTSDDSPSDESIVNTVTKITRKRIIKKIIYVNGEPVETEEVVEEPETSISQESSPVEENKSFVSQSGAITRVTRKRIIKKIIYIDGVPTETEEVIEEPETSEEVESPVSVSYEDC